MAPPVGTLRVGRYFLALLALFAVLYSVVAFGSRHTPKLGLDLVGGIRVIFTAQTPKGSPPPTSDQMTQARQILEDRINGTGVTGSTVVVQGSDQLVVEIPGGTDTDVNKLGTAAILNFRGVAGPAQPVTCVPKGVKIPPTSSSASPTPTGGSSASPSTGSSASTSPSPTSSGAAASSGASRAPDAAAERPLAAAPSGSTSSSAGSSSGVASSPATGSATSPSGSAATSPSGSATTSAAAPAATRCLADPFTNAKSSAAVRALPAELAKLYKVTTKDPPVQQVLPNAESCPSPGISSADCRPYSSLSAAQMSTISTALQSLDCSSTQTELDVSTGAYYACDDGKQLGGIKAAYLLGHVVVAGKNIDSASAQAPNITNGQTQWTVALTLTSTGGDKWNAWTSKYNTTSTTASSIQTSTTAPCGVSVGTPCSDFVGFTLDGVVISAPITQAVLDINTSISGSFDSGSANALAQQLNYGKLPVSFRPDANAKVSATLGKQQLHAALLAGGIGLLLVVIYSLLYYRALGLVTIASLLVSAGLTYGFLVLLGTQIGFTLDLAGIAGFIVALGITADSFVVFFERLKDEVHEGRSVRVAVPRAWVRARRTILSADTVSFLAAAILYYFAAADVKGFAFTLGMSTILDLVVVFLFTHPIVSILSRSKTFGSARITGLDSVRGRTPVDDSPSAIARSSESTSAAAPATQAPATQRPAASVAVAERDDDEPEAVDEPSDVIDSDEDEARERRRTEPEAGSAAERAAARRARMRENRDTRRDGEKN